MKKALIVGLSILLLVAAAPSYAGKTIKFNNQKAGQLCKSTEVNLSVNLPTGAVLTCLKANSKAKPKWAKTKSQISTPTRNPITSSPMPTPNPSTTIKDGVPKQGQVCTANSADVIGYDLNGKFTDLMCNQFDNRYFPRSESQGAKPIDPQTGNPLSPKPAPKPTYADDDVTKKIQLMIEGSQILDYLQKVKIITEVEPAENGIYADQLIDQLKNSVNFYGSIGLLPKYEDIYYAIGRNQDWLKQKAAINCGPLFGDVDSSVSVGTCSSNSERTGMYTNIPRAMMREGASPSTNLSMIKIIYEAQNWNCGDNCITEADYLHFIDSSPHEFFHAYQAATWITLGNWYEKLPRWFTEGSADSFSKYTLSASPNNLGTFGHISKLSYPEVSRGGNLSQQCSVSFLTIHESLKSNSSTTNPYYNCMYPEGSMATDVIVANLGSFSKFGEFMNELSKTIFEDAIQKYLGMSFQEYTKLVDAHARSFGWASTTN